MKILSQRQTVVFRMKIYVYYILCPSFFHFCLIKVTKLCVCIFFFISEDNLELEYLRIILVQFLVLSINFSIPILKFRISYEKKERRTKYRQKKIILYYTRFHAPLSGRIRNSAKEQCTVRFITVLSLETQLYVASCVLSCHFDIAIRYVFAIQHHVANNREIPAPGIGNAKGFVRLDVTISTEIQRDPTRYS